MKKRFIMTLAVGALLVAMLSGVASAAQANVKTKDACKDGGWMGLADLTGAYFQSEQECKGFAKAGNTPLPPEPPGTIIAIAYTNVDRIDGYNALQGDILIARLVDTDNNGLDTDDRLDMGQYPTTLAEPYAFADWGVDSHLVTSVLQDDGENLSFFTASAGHQFIVWPDRCESFSEYNPDPATASPYAEFTDGIDGSCDDHLEVEAGSASAPPTPAFLRITAPGDHAFVDVDLFVN